MTRKQLLTRTEIAKMDGENKVHFLNPQARRRNKSLGDAAGLVALGVHLIEIPMGQLPRNFIVIFMRKSACSSLMAAGWRGLGMLCIKTRRVILSAIRRVANRMISEIPAPDR